MKEMLIILIVLILVGCNINEKSENLDRPISSNNADTISQPNNNFSDQFIDGIPKTVEQNIFGTTKIVLSKLGDPYDLHLYGQIEFFIEGQKVFEYKEKYLQVEGYQDKVCDFFGLKQDGQYNLFYIFRFSNRPSPDGFLVIRESNKKMKIQQQIFLEM